MTTHDTTPNAARQRQLDATPEYRGSASALAEADTFARLVLSDDEAANVCLFSSTEAAAELGRLLISQLSGFGQADWHTLLTQHAGLAWSDGDADYIKALTLRAEAEDLRLLEEVRERLQNWTPSDGNHLADMKTRLAKQQAGEAAAKQLIDGMRERMAEYDRVIEANAIDGAIEQLVADGHATVESDAVDPDKLEEWKARLTGRWHNRPEGWTPFDDQDDDDDDTVG